jgi:hypothetical protein
MVMMTADELPRASINVDEIETLIQWDGNIEIRMVDGATYTVVDTTLRQFFDSVCGPKKTKISGRTVSA